MLGRIAGRTYLARRGSLHSNKQRAVKADYTMKQNEPGNSYSSQAPGALDEARALFKQMTNEAARRSGIEQQEALRRGPLIRFLLALTIAACLLAAATGLYGVYNFPDAPIRQMQEGLYLGKGGQPHTLEEFERFILWERVMFVVFPSAFVLGFAFAITDSMKRRKRTSSGAEGA